MNKLFIIGLIAFSCTSEFNSKNKSQNIIPKDTMVMVLKDLSILESHIKTKYPQIQQSYKTVTKSSEIVLKKYNLDTARFNSAMNYYVPRQKEMQEIYSQILDSVNRELTELTIK
jgi:hypothetical protein